MAKLSAAAQARDAKREEKRTLRDGAATSGVKTLDSFVNYAQKLGIGADNSLSTASYGYNPITRNRTQLEWIHRGSWIGGQLVDVVADDMTREGIAYATELPPGAAAKIDEVATRLSIWPTLNESIKWSRLYGGAIAVMLVNGQDMRTPLDLARIEPGGFRGLIALDRWMVEPVLNDLVTELGPHLGMPRYYRVTQAAPALRGQVIHYSRLAGRFVGVKMPYQQALTEQLWGISVLERVFDRMIAFDTASTGAAQLVGKSYLRTMKVKSLREVIAAGGKALNGFVAYMEMTRRYQGIEGITAIDAEDEFTADAHGAFSGLDDVLTQFALQISGATQIPLTRLFGQSPGGMNATGDNDMRNYYDHINQRQQQDMMGGTTRVYRAIAASEGVPLPPDFAVEFPPLWQLTETDRANVAKTTTDTVMSVHEGGLISDRTALQELRKMSRITGVFTQITPELIASADVELNEPPPPPMPPGMGGGMPGGGDEGGAPGGEDDQSPFDNNAGAGDGAGEQDGSMGAGAGGGPPVRSPSPGAGRERRRANPFAG